MKVYVTWDPLYEKVVCVHDKPKRWCLKCKEIEERANKTHCYYPEEGEFELITDEKLLPENG